MSSCLSPAKLNEAGEMNATYRVITQRQHLDSTKSKVRMGGGTDERSHTNDEMSLFFITYVLFRKTSSWVKLHFEVEIWIEEAVISVRETLVFSWRDTQHSTPLFTYSCWHRLYWFATFINTTARLSPRIHKPTVAGSWWAAGRRRQLAVRSVGPVIYGKKQLVPTGRRSQFNIL